jgi:hypothetical protein
MARCFKLIKELPLIPVGAYYKANNSGLNVYLSLSTNEWMFSRPELNLSGSLLPLYTLPMAVALSPEWFEEVESVPDHGDASTYFHGKNWYWTGPRFEYKDGEYWYCQRKCKEITAEKCSLKLPITDQIRDEYKIDTISDYPAASWEVFQYNGEYLVIGNTLAGPKFLKVIGL